jgi:hypothetical protein
VTTTKQEMESRKKYEGMTEESPVKYSMEEKGSGET